MQKTLYIHIGTEKTGTTVLQSTFHRNRELLQESSINYPAIGFYAQAQFSLVSPLIKEETGKKFEVAPPDYDVSKEEAWSELVDNLNKSNCIKHIICVEHFSSRLGESSIKWIGEFLKDKLESCFKVKLITYIRRPDQYLESSFSTAIKAGDTRTFSEFKESESRNEFRYNHLKMLSNWTEVFGHENLILRVFERNKMIDGDIVSDVLNILGDYNLDLERSTLANDTNEAWHPKTIRLAIFINRNVRLKSKLGDKKLSFLNELDINLKKLYPNFGKKYMTQSEAIKFNSNFYEANKVISSLYFKDIDLFDNRYPDESDVIAFDSIELYDAIELLINNIVR